MSTQKPSKKSGNCRCSGGPPAEWFWEVILCLPDTAVRAESAKKTPPFGWCFWSGRRGSNSLPGIPRMAVAIRGSPASPQIKRASHRSRQRLPACPLSHSKRENPILTDGIFSFGAGDEARTRYRHPTNGCRHSQEPCLTSDQTCFAQVEAASSPVLRHIPKRIPHPVGWGILFGAGDEARTRFPASHEWLSPFVGALPHLRSNVLRTGRGSDFQPARCLIPKEKIPS